MKLWTKILLFMIVLTSSLSVIGTSKAFAANQTITLSPSSAELKLNQGSVTSGSFQVLNQGIGKFNFKVYPAPYSIKGEDYTPDFEPIAGAINPADWIKFSVANSSVDTGGSVTVNYKITVPKNVQDGGYYLAAFAETDNPKASVGVTINERVGLLLFVQVGNNVVNAGSVVDWKSGFLQKPPLISVAKVENTGSIYLKANYTYKVSDIFGNVKFSVDGQKYIFPQTRRSITFPWKNSPSFGLFKVSANMNFLGSDHKLPTKYVLVMSSAARIYSIIALVVIVVASIIFGFVKKKSRKKHKLSRRR